LLGISNNAFSDFVELPKDPRQSISYWKPFEIAETDDKRVAETHAIFNQLLRAWDSTRVEPKLYVVKSSSGPWAASLEDGSIILSKAALDVAYLYDDKSEHYLAFVLGHELAHQVNEHLWHLKFFRLTAQMDPTEQQGMLRGLDHIEMDSSDIEQKEIQADQDALVYMALVGFNPFVIVEDKDFFTLWAENIWGNSCEHALNDIAQSDACKQAFSRALRSRTKLQELVAQTTLFELGSQFYISGNYPDAYRYFLAFGREFPGHSVQENIGLSLLAQALEIKNQLIIMGVIQEPLLSYPVMLGLAPSFFNSANRAIENQDKAESKRLLYKLDMLSTKATQSFEKAININPDNKQHYVNLISSYLIARNIPMARGILEGKYEKKFGKDHYTELLAGLSFAVSNEALKAKEQLQKLISNLSSDDITTPKDKVLLTSVYNNMAAILYFENDRKSAQKVISEFAKKTQQSKDGALFQLALMKLGAIPAKKNHNKKIQNNEINVGDNYSSDQKQNITKAYEHLQMEGEHLQKIRLEDNRHIVTNSKDIIISLLQTGEHAEFAPHIEIGSPSTSLISKYGVPARRVFTLQGEYFSYDDLGVAFKLIRNRISGWFFYPI
jgi:tetratricopeptide (TPR) repeat protein